MFQLTPESDIFPIPGNPFRSDKRRLQPEVIQGIEKRETRGPFHPAGSDQDETRLRRKQLDKQRTVGGASNGVGTASKRSVAAWGIHIFTQRLPMSALVAKYQSRCLIAVELFLFLLHKYTHCVRPRQHRMLLRAV